MKCVSLNSPKADLFMSAITYGIFEAFGFSAVSSDINVVHLLQNPNFFLFFFENFVLKN